MIDTNGNPTSYNCQINEYQRKMMIKAFICMLAHQSLELETREGDVNDTMFEEAELFLEMLFNLIGDERRHPDIKHGLCL